jgi:hypothetical protein
LTVQRGRYYTVGGGAVVLLIIVAPLYQEFHEAGMTGWNIFLVLALASVVVAAFFLQRFFFQHAGEIGEARFDTRNKGDADG